MRHDDAVRQLINEQFAEYEDARNEHELAEWQRLIKNYVDWFIVKYDKLLTKRCRIAAQKLHMRGDTWQDLKSECVIEAYRVGERFDPTKGDLTKFLLGSLWNFMFSKKHINNYTVNAFGESGADGSFEHILEASTDPAELKIANKSRRNRNRVDNASKHYLHDFCVSDEPRLDSILSGLEHHEKTLLNCKLVLKMNNCQIAELLGTGESTIRYRLANVLGKLKISGK